MSPLRMSLAVSAAVAVVLGSTAVAAAQSAPEFDSPSEIDATGRGAQTQITYTNQTDHTLTCVVHVGDPEIVRAMHADAAPGDGPIDDETLLAQIDTAMTEGRLALAMGDVPAGQTADIPLLFPLTDDSFEPIAVGHCNGHGSDYIEVETDVPASAAGSLGSIDIFGSLGTGTSSLEPAVLG